MAVLAVWAGFAAWSGPVQPRGRVVSLPSGPSAPGVWAVDLAQPGRLRAQPLPEAPFPSQKTPPCGGAQVERRGGCWYRVQPDETKLKPGEVCSPELYQDGKECLLPVLEPGRRPIAGTP
jgi:hypothetical protein